MPEIMVCPDSWSASILKEGQRARDAGVLSDRRGSEPLRSAHVLQRFLRHGDRLLPVATADALLKVCLPDYILWMQDLSPIINFEPFAELLRNEGKTWLADIMTSENSLGDEAWNSPVPSQNNADVGERAERQIQFYLSSLLGFTALADEFKLEILVKEESGNQTAVETCFALSG